jgi:hypothetical protein
MSEDERVTFEASVSEPDEGGPARMFVWVRRFRGSEELTGRYEVFSDLPRLDEFIARAAAAGRDTAGLLEARERFAETLGKST